MHIYTEVIDFNALLPNHFITYIPHRRGPDSI